MNKDKTTQVREKQIPFSGEMIRAILEGRKNVTRRFIAVDTDEVVQFDNASGTPRVLCKGSGRIINCPYGGAGTRLWVRETWQTVGDEIFYRADYLDDPYVPKIKWRPSIHMPRYASRLMLENLGVRVERFMSITDDEAKREGFGRRNDFIRFFDGSKIPAINNPYVWVIDFKVVKMG